MNVIMECVTQINDNMALVGWRGPAETGFSHKVDVEGQIVAYNHDATWLADVREAVALAEIQMARREFERRTSSSGQAG